jgi:alkaline phosphatase
VILLIADGAGTSYWTAANFAAGPLAVASMPVVGLVDTRSADSRVTDSAASATAYATGVRTYNGAIGVGVGCVDMWRADSVSVMRNPAGCDPLTTVVDVAESSGMATGLIATSSITHATPASFAAHVPSRNMQAEIASQLAASNVDVLLGGGRGFFDGGLRSDSVTLLDAVCADAVCLSDAAGMASYRADDRRLIGLFASNHMDPAPTRAPGLPAMTRTALARLDRNPNGFFLMVEGSQPDWRGHDNAPISELIDEMVDFDDAVQVALDFARANAGTLVVVTADHETGGLAIGESADTLTGTYTTDYHTAAMVPLFADGPGSDRFAGIIDIDAVGRLLMNMLRREP